MSTNVEKQIFELLHPFALCLSWLCEHHVLEMHDLNHHLASFADQISFIPFLF